MEVDVRTGKHVRQAFAANIMLSDIFFHSRQCQRAGRFCYRTHVFKQVFHRRADGIAINGDDVVEILLTETESLITDTFNRHAFGK